MSQAGIAGTLEPGADLVGRYSLVRRLGEGGMGVVWEATQRTTGKHVAIKVLKPTATESADAARFLREAKVSAGLSHRNIVQVFDYWEVENGPVFLVMELLVGETLAALLQQRKVLSVAETSVLVGPAANALAMAHGLGVVHRDIKPENLFIARSGEHAEIKILDFGLAKPVVPDAHATAVTQTGSLMGTPFYMSPEQVYGEKGIDSASDVWSLGVVLYECLTGQKPFGGENFGQIFRSITQTVPRAMRALAPGIPPELDALVMRMVAHERAARPSMADVAGTLASSAARPIQASVPGHELPATTAQMTQPLRTPSRIPPGTLVAASTSVPPFAASGATSASSADVNNTSGANDGRRSGLVAPLLAGVVLCVGAVAVTMLWPRGSKPADAIALPPPPALGVGVAPSAPSAAAAAREVSDPRETAEPRVPSESAMKPAEDLGLAVPSTAGGAGSAPSSVSSGAEPSTSAAKTMARAPAVRTTPQKKEEGGGKSKGEPAAAAGATTPAPPRDPLRGGRF